MKYTVRHYHPNPRHNSSVGFDTKKEAIEELREMHSEDKGCSNLLMGEKVVAFRDWNKKKITWMAPRKKSVAH